MEPGDSSGEQVRQAIADFKRAMELRGDLNLRVAKRVTAILRTGMFSFAVISVIMVGMLVAFTSRVTEMIVVLDTMRDQFRSMTTDVQRMRLVVARMDEDMRSFPVVTAEMVAMRDHVARMSEDLRSVAATVDGMHAKMQVVTANVEGMNQSFRGLEPSVIGIGSNVNRASEPVKMFNSFFPW